MKKMYAFPLFFAVLNNSISYGFPRIKIPIKGNGKILNLCKKLKKDNRVFAKSMQDVKVNSFDLKEKAICWHWIGVTLLVGGVIAQGMKLIRLKSKHDSMQFKVYPKTN